MRDPDALGDHARQASSRAGAAVDVAQGPSPPGQRAEDRHQHAVGIDGAAGERLERDGPRRDVGRIGGRAQVEAEADHDGREPRPDHRPLGQDAGQLAGWRAGRVDHDVVRPLQGGAHARRVGNRLDDGDAGHDRQQAHRRIGRRTRGGRWLRAKDDRQVETGPGWRRPHPAASAAAGRLRPGHDPGAVRRAGRGPGQRVVVGGRRRRDDAALAAERPQLASRGVEQRLQVRRHRLLAAALSRARAAPAALTPARSRS